MPSDSKVSQTTTPEAGQDEVRFMIWGKIVGMEEDLPQFPPQIRPLRTRSDLLAMADLVELCFAESMDADGRDYLWHMRRLASNNTIFNSTGGLQPGSRMPVQGFLWEEDGHIVGNLTIIPFHQSNCRTYLVANVAVQPQYRRRGIARQLTLKSLDYARLHNARNLWLHVREENLSAQELYRSIGFVERVRRTTWQSEPVSPKKSHELPSGMRVETPRARDWPLLSKWFGLNYPPEVIWNLRFDPTKYQPGLLRGFWRFLNNENVVHIAGYERDQLLGSGIWQPTRLHADMLWLASAPAQDEKAIPLVLGQIWRWTHALRPLMINFPAGRADDLFERCNFSKQNTLIWMEYPLRIDKGE